MSTKKKLLELAKLYCVLDAGVLEYDRLFDIVRRSADAGVDVFQIRDKDGSDQDIAAFTKQCVAYLGGKKLFIVNDRIHVALEAGADGVHVGQQDNPIEYARKVAGEDLMVGVSCQTLTQAHEAQQKGADYIGFGSVFKTQTKPHRYPMDLTLLADVLKEISIPVFPIGGITVENCGLVKELGACRFAVTREICLAENVEEKTKALKNILET